MNIVRIFFATFMGLVVFMFILIQQIYSANKARERDFILTVRPKTILYWTKFFSTDDFEIGYGNVFKNCPVSNCYMTNKRDLLDIEEYDALFFHGAEYKFSKHGVPSKRSSEQVYVYYNLESPLHTKNYVSVNNFYNWTMTYRYDSDIFRPYGFVVKEDTNYTIPTKEEIQERPKKIAWFVSNCRTPSYREKLTRELQQYFTVDIYGDCGDLWCSRLDAENCYNFLEKNYKFYLSFENSYCEDYVTEKVYNILKLNIVPIVYGGCDYEKVAPPHSVIDVSKFENIQDVVNIVRRLDNNITAYLEYFKWKEKYVIDQSNDRFLCDLCDKLNKPIKKKSYHNIKEWWIGKSENVCKPLPRIIAN